MTEDDAVAVARHRVMRDAADDLSRLDVPDVTEESDGWWVRWGPPEGCLGGGPNLFVSKIDGTVRDMYYSQ